MIVLIDRAGAEKFRYRTKLADRTYYCAAAPYRMVAVCKDYLDLHALIGQAVDAAIGWDDGWRDFVRAGNENQPHSKLTIYRASAQRAQRTLSQLLRDAPKERKPT